MIQMNWQNFRDSKPEAIESEPGEENAQIEEQWQLTSEGGEESEPNEQILNIRVDGNSAARITINIEGQDKIALIDTGAGRCCMNEEHYQTLGSPPLEPANVDLWLQTASGALMPGMGFLTCNMQIGS